MVELRVGVLGVNDETVWRVFGLPLDRGSETCNGTSTTGVDTTPGRLGETLEEGRPS